MIVSQNKVMHDALEYAARIAYSSREVLHFTYQKAKEYSDKPGVYVECGVAAGAQIIAMIAGAPNKRVYAIDSFTGIPLPSNRDDQMPGIRFLSKAEQKALPNPGEQILESTGATAVKEIDFWINLSQAFNKQLKYHEALGMTIYQIEGINVVPVVGWFEETLPKFYCEAISILRLDGDLYNSTYVCLKHLYPKVIKGGLVIIDDWALPGCRQAVNDYFNDRKAPFRNEPLKMQFIKDENSTVAYWTKQ